MKILAEEKSRKLLGVHILGAHASELIAEATLALAARLTADELADTCHAHPTLSEADQGSGPLASFQGADPSLIDLFPLTSSRLF